MSSMMGEKLRVSLFGQSHGAAVGVVVDGLPAGEEVDLAQLQAFLDRRAPGRGALSTPRREADIPRVLSGLLDGKTCGAPLCAMLENADTRPGDYTEQGRVFRPSHADYPAHVRDRGFEDASGGGHFSGRLTASLCVAGGVALQILARRGVFIGAHLERVGDIADRRYNAVRLNREELHLPGAREFPVLEIAAGKAMEKEIACAREEGDSIGGVIECAAIGMPVGIGEPMFSGMENRLAAALWGIPGVRGVEFGSGFACARMRGSEHNDPYRFENGKVTTATNHHGGILGGITTGMPILFRVAMKPTASIAKPQQTLNFETLEEVTLKIKGRHDPCIALRAVPCAEAAAALALLDALLQQ